MAAVIKVKLDTARLDQIAKDLDKNRDQVLGMLAYQVEGIAKMLAPVDTGALRNSLQTEQQKPGTWWVHDGVEYGIYQEFGTHKMAAHPFMVPAAEQVGRDLNNGKTWEKLV